MKKILFFIMFTLIVSMLVIPAAASCDVCMEQEPVKPAEHCEELCTGDHYETCYACNDQFLFEYCTAVHKYTATYIGNSKHRGVCVCGESYSTDCTKELVSTSPSTCVDNGYNTYKCTICHAPIKETLPLGDHSFPEEPIIHHPTCTTVGYNHWECESCDHSYDDGHVKALGHDWDTGFKDAECTVDGYNYKVCKRCGLDQTTKIAATGHKWSASPTSCDSTCFYAGTAIYVCTVCGEEETRKAGKLPHNYVDGICTMCGAKAPVGGNTGGNGGGNSGTAPGPSGGGSSDVAPDISPRRLLSLTCVALVVIAVFAAATKKKSKRR